METNVQTSYPLSSAAVYITTHTRHSACKIAHTHTHTHTHLTFILKLLKIVAKKKKKKSPRKNVPNVGIELEAACIPSGHASDRATAPGDISLHTPYTSVMFCKIRVHVGVGCIMRIAIKIQLSSHFDDIAYAKYMYTDAKVQIGTCLHSFKGYKYVRITFWMTLVVEPQRVGGKI